MASWGPKIYQNDIALDVKTEYNELLKCEKSNEDTTMELIKSYQFLLSDNQDAPIFWFALADTQWNMGRLLPFVKEKALEYIVNGDNLKQWELENPKSFIVRKQVLQELEQKLNSPQPPIKKIKPYKYFKCSWQVGDTFAFRLEGNYAKENGLGNRYLIINKLDEHIWKKGDSGDIFPIIYVKLTNDSNLPKDFKELEDCDFIKLNISSALKKAYYRQLSYNKSKKFFDKLIYLGNYKLTPPKDEIIMNDKDSITGYDWNSKNFEVKIVDKYFNLKDK